MRDDKTITAYEQNVAAYEEMVKAEKPGTDMRLFLEELPTRGRVLDLGCGPGNSARFLKDAGHTVEAVDASPEMVRLANTKHNLNAKVGTFDSVAGESIYDGVWANFSLLHAERKDFLRHLHSIHNALKENGLFHIGMKLGQNSKRDRLGRYYTYYGEDELRTILEGAGFRIHWSKTGKERGLAGDIDPWIVFRSRAIKH